ncbi:hypothetical protein ACFLTZ_01255 [Chloroflexota bacterium]
MKFFLLWIVTRLKEKGWPKTRGLLRKRRVLTEEVVIAATQDTIRIAITIGGSMPEVARAIAMTCVELFDKPLTGKAVDDWIDEAATMGNEKMENLSDIFPEWLRFCSITAVSNAGDVKHLSWVGAHEKYDMEDPIVNKMYVQATALAVIAMCWALRHPNGAQNLFHNPDALEHIERDLPAELRGLPELQESVSGPAIYSAWLHMAEMLVSRYSEEEGLPSYEELP